MPEPASEAEPKGEYHLIKELEINQLEFSRTIRAYTHYDPEPFLVTAVSSSLGETDSFSKSLSQLAGLKRKPELEKVEIKDPVSGKIIRPKEIADANFQKMEKATALKWYAALNQLFRAKEFRKVPIHNPDGRLKIAIPGCALGFEVGGILDFFNEQGIPVDIDAVDVNEAGGERQFLKLEEREKIKGSKVNFLSQTDAREFYKGKQYDLVVMRHPGFVFEESGYYMWKQIIEVLAETKPGIVIVSTYGHKLKDDPYYIEEVLDLKGKEEIYESDVIEKLLSEHGFKGTEDYEGWVSDNLLYYPQSPYMIACDRDGDKLRWTLPVDREITIFGSAEYLKQAAWAA